MALGEWIRFRVSEAQARIYEAEAEARGVPLGTYVRERLEQAGALRDELATLQASVDEVATIVEELRSRDHSAEPATTPASPVAGQGVAVETLLLLRTLAGPQKSKMVAAEVKRLGHDVWDAEEGR